LLFRCVHYERIIQGIGCTDCAFVPSPLVWEQAVGKGMLALVGGWIGIGGAAQEADANDVITDVVPVLAVVEHTDAIAAFAKIDPFLCASLETCPVPTGIAVRRTLNVAPLDLISCLGCQNVDWESYIEKNISFDEV